MQIRMQEALTQVKVQTPFLKRHYHNFLTLSLLFADVLSNVLGFVAGFRLRLLIPLPDRAENLHFGDLLPMLGMQIAFVCLAFFLSRMYHRQRTRYSSDEIAAIFSGVSVGTLLTIAITSLTFKNTSSSFDYSRGVIIYAWLTTIGFVFVIRSIQGRLQRWLQMRGYGRTRVVVVGAGETALALLQRITQLPRLGYDLVGMVCTNGDTPPPGVISLGGR